MASYMPKRRSSDRTHNSTEPSEPEPDTPGARLETEFDRLVERHYGALCTFALRFLRSRDAAEDAVQEVLAKLWARWATVELRDPVPYLYRAVRNECLMALRRQRRWNTTDIETSESVDLITPEQDELFELQAAIEQAIDALPERTRLVFTMHRQQDLTYGEIARALGISIKTVETQMTRALKMLRRQLDRFFSLGAAMLSATELWQHWCR